MTWLVSFVVQGDGNVQMCRDVSQALEELNHNRQLEDRLVVLDPPNLALIRARGNKCY